MPEEKKPASAGTPPACLPPALRKPRLRRDQASAYLELQFGVTVAPATLAKYASIGGGPRFQRLGRTPLYPREELDIWIVARLGAPVSSTSEHRE